MDEPKGLDQAAARELARSAWEENAAFWDERMGEGNRFHLELVWPASERLLAATAGQRILDVGCGNGLTCRRLARQGIDVVGVDFSAAMLERARERGTPGPGSIEYRQVDATDEDALAALGAGSFDGLIANMALMDMAEVAPLYRAAARLLKPGGRFVLSVMHPAFNGREAEMVEDAAAADGSPPKRWLKVRGYLERGATVGEALRGQPVRQPYFMRPLEALLGEAFEAGLVLDGLVEPAFSADAEPPAEAGLNWASFPHMPPVLVGRLRTPPRAGGATV